MDRNPTYEEMEKRVKELEKELKGYQDHFQLLGKMSPGAIYKADVNGNCTYVNECWCELVGLSREKALGRGWSEALHPKDRDRITKAWHEIVDSGKAWNDEYRFLSAKGETIWVQGFALPIRNEEGSVTGYFGINFDITERKQAEEALRESEGRMRSIFEAAKNVSLLMAKPTSKQDSDPVICEFSPGAEKIFGYSREEIVGKPVGILHLPEDAAKFKEMHRRLKKGKTGFNGEITLVRKSGEKFPALLSTHPLFDKYGEMYAALGVSLDISEQKILEARLRQTHKMESIGTLAGGIAHEFNNILGIIVGNAELAMDSVSELNKAHQYLKEILTACLRARDTVKQILTYTRHIEHELKPVKLVPVVEEALKLIRASIPTTIEIRKNILCDRDIVKANPAQVTEVIINLCVNAAHAMGDQGGVLEVTLEDLELDGDAVALYHGLPPGNYLATTVTDTGHGIEPEIIERVFDPYFTTKEFGEGTGLGLSMAQAIIMNHDGAISVLSEPLKGATFRVFLPCIEGEVSSDIEPTEPLQKGKERILFVDDEPAMVDIFKPILERLGYKVVARTSSLEALEAFRNQPDEFDLVITDQAMPSMPGKRLAKELIDIRADIPIILCTGHSDQIDEEKAKGIGIRAFVMKPIMKSDIAKTIRKVLDEK